MPFCLLRSWTGCAALTTLALLVPHICAAQKTAAPAVAPDTVSLFAAPLTRAGLGSITHLQSSVAPLAHTAADGHLVVTGMDTNVLVPAGHYVELLPNIEIAGFHPASLAVFENGTRTQTFGMDRNSSGIPFLRVDPPTGAVNRKRVQVALYDAQGAVRTVQQCVLRSHGPAVAPTLGVKMVEETCLLSVADRQTLGAVDLALNGCALGRLAAGEAQAGVDARHLAPGHYTCEMFGQGEDGVLLPPVQTEFDVAPRYEIALPVGATPVHISTPSDSGKIAISVACKPGAHIVKTRVYVDGEFVAENASDRFIQDVPFMAVPTCKTTIDVIGVGADGTLYPVESVPIEVKNEVWEGNIFPTPDYALLQAKRSEVAENRRQFEMWYEKFAHEPFSRVAGREWGTYLMRDGVTGHNYWQTIVNDRYVPTDAVVFKRNADKYLHLMAQAQLEAGRLEARLKMKQQARRRFGEVIREVGEDSGTGAQARAELTALAQIKA